MLAGAEHNPNHEADSGISENSLIPRSLQNGQNSTSQWINDQIAAESNLGKAMESGSVNEGRRNFIPRKHRTSISR